MARRRKQSYSDRYSYGIAPSASLVVVGIAMVVLYIVVLLLIGLYVYITLR